MSLRLPEGYRLKAFDTIDSTSEEARRLAAAGDPGPLWIVAREQTAGRGRRGRTWASPRGNLMTTLLLRPPVAAEEAARLSFVATLAVAETVSRFAPAARVALKWPNDVLAEGGKVAGILLESHGAGASGIDWLSVGIGINLASHPEDVPYPACSLAGLGVAPPEPDTALTVLAERWAHWYARWIAAGFAPIRAAWLMRAKGVGEVVTARLADSVLEGVFVGLSETGALELRLPSGLTRAVTAGEVFFGSTPGTHDAARH